MTNAATRLETHPPLARDIANNLLPVPEGTAALAVSRETAGRPQKIRGPDKLPIRFPLHTTSDDLVELCGPGIYRVYALDKLGELVADEHIAKWDLNAPSRELRNASMDPMLVPRAERISMSTASPSTDLRFALETMAQMMRTNSDALRLVAESQVDLAKTIATVKGLPRNAAMYLPPSPPAANDTDDEEADDDEEPSDEHIEQAAPTNFIDLLMPFSQAVAGKVADMVPGLIGGVAAMSSGGSANAVAPSTEEDVANRPFEMKEIVNWDYARQKGAAKRAVRQQPAAAQQPRPAAQQQQQAVMALQARVVKDPQLLQQFMAIKNHLSSEESRTLLSAVAWWPEDAQTKLLDTLKPLPVGDAVEYCREVIKMIRVRRASVEVQADTDGGADVDVENEDDDEQEGV
jgi:hypothetical protein